MNLLYFTLLFKYFTILTATSIFGFAVSAVTTYNGDRSGTANPLLVDLAFIQIHTHMTIYKCQKFYVHKLAVSLMGEPEQHSPPVCKVLRQNVA
jgi:hypothetical protein